MFYKCYLEVNNMLYYKNENDLTVYFANGDIATWTRDHPNFNKVYKLCKKSNWEEIQVLYNLNKAIINSDKVVVNNNGITVNNIIVSEDTPVLNFIKLLKKKGVVEDNINRIKPFLINMFKNPFIDAPQEIYDYCKAMDFEITDDGCFLAYKNVRSDLGSIYDNGATKHKIGEYTEVKMYDTDRTNTCSKGLHFCSKSYLNHYAGDVTIIVKINPMDVVSIPVDYNFAKGRCRKYMTVGILNDKDKMLKDVNVNDLVCVSSIIRVESMPVYLNNSIDETAYWMKVFNNDEEKVAERMNIKVSTVQRNMRKYRERSKENNNASKV